MIILIWSSFLMIKFQHPTLTFLSNRFKKHLNLQMSVSLADKETGWISASNKEATQEKLRLSRRVTGTFVDGLQVHRLNRERAHVGTHPLGNDSVAWANERQGRTRVSAVTRPPSIKRSFHGSENAGKTLGTTTRRSDPRCSGRIAVLSGQIVNFDCAPSRVRGWRG